LLLLATMAPTWAASREDSTVAAGGPMASSSGSVTKQVKKLKRKVRSVEAQLAGLQAQLAALQGGSGSPRPPTGAAGGDLTGSYPNPLIGPNAVGTAEVDGTLTGADVATDSLLGADIDEASLGSRITALPFSSNGLTLAVSFPTCSGGGAIQPVFTATTSTSNARVGIASNSSGGGGWEVDVDFDTGDSASVTLSVAALSTSGHITVEYSRSTLLIGTDRVSVDLIFQAVNSSGSCSTAVSGRAIG
jgi:hypothetical protein